MLFDNFLDPLLFTSIAITLLHFLWQGLAVAVILACLLKVVDNKHSKLRYTFSSIAMLINLLLPIITFFVIQQPQTDTIYKATGIHTNHLLGLTILPEKSSLNETVISLLPYLTILWLVVSAYLAGKLLYQMVTVNRLPKHGVMPASSVLNASFNQLVARLGLSQHVSLRISLNIDVPMAVGWIKPVVLLPASMLTGLTPAQLEMLLLHELAHIKRYDYLVNLLQSLVEMLLFFHPAVFWVSKQMRIEREYCSDDIAVKHCGDALAYAHTLTDTASLCHQHRHATPVMAMAASGGDLTQRVLRLVSQHHCLTGYDKSKWFAAITVVSFLFLLITTQVRHIDGLGIDKVYSPSLIETLSHAYTNSGYQRVAFSSQNEHVNTTKPQASTISLQYDLAVKIITEKTPNEQQAANKEYLNSSRTQLLNSARAFSNSTEKERLEKVLSNNQTSSSIVESNHQDNGYSEKRLDPIEKFEQANTQTINHVLLSSTESVTQKNQQYSPESTHSDVLSNYDEKQSNKANYKAAKVLSIVQPNYPSKAERKNIQMDLVVNFSIDALGNINNIEIENKSKAYYFKSSIKSALKKWKVLPAERDGQPVSSNMTKIFSFYLKNTR